MSFNVAQEDSVLVSLSTTDPPNLTHPERRILITESQPKVYIGRSSNRTTLGLLPDMSNGWFDSPALKVRDAGSMHGTYLNKEKLGSDIARPLVAGDEMTFGMPVYRNQTIFKPATMTVGVEFRNAARVNNPPSRVFAVPDDCSTDENLDENEPLDDDIPNGTSLLAHQERGNCPAAMRQVDGAIEIDSNSAPIDLISISSDDNDDDDGTHDDGEESISLTDDEQMSSVPASPIESVDLDDTVQMDGLENRSPTWNRFSSYSESEQMDEDSPSIRLPSDDEHGVFLYDSDSEDKDEMEDDGPVGDDSDPSPPMVNYPSIFTGPQMSESVAPMLPPLSAAVFDHPQYIEMPFGYQLPPVGRSLPRQPSPSDAVLPLSHRHHGSEDDSAMVVEDLGRKWGKTDFFEAREHNKITNSRLTGPDPSSDASSVPNSATETSNNAAAEDDCILPSSEDLVDHTESSTTETAKPTGPSASERLSQASESTEIASRPVEPQKQFSRVLMNQIPQAPLIAKPDRNPYTLESGEDSLRSSLHDANAMEIPMQCASEAHDFIPESAYQLRLQKLREQALENLKKQELVPEARRDFANNASATDSANGLPKDRAKGKRKAADISEATEEELVWQEQLAWHDKGNPMTPPAPSSPATQSEPDVFLPSPPTTPQDQHLADARPSKKIKKIAERMGYAALGGATVGAMVFTSLVYTAPSFV
ncbi:hypothetical protein VPNG_06570 [Cytospora leucostoma]|uniref:FHA domain-containing protein n=1 Tax=Cytospora leucostoma TaxID=1230097 RepID=A0A423X2Q4_9PEZI|nr:hypothetical protein VPNG_06570 [Cytospora leucostoma]